MIKQLLLLLFLIISDARLRHVHEAGPALRRLASQQLQHGELVQRPIRKLQRRQSFMAAERAAANHSAERAGHQAAERAAGHHAVENQAEMHAFQEHDAYKFKKEPRDSKTIKAEEIELQKHRNEFHKAATEKHTITKETAQLAHKEKDRQAAADLITTMENAWQDWETERQTLRKKEKAFYKATEKVKAKDEVVKAAANTNETKELAKEEKALAKEKEKRLAKEEKALAKEKEKREKASAAFKDQSEVTYAAMKRYVEAARSDPHVVDPRVFRQWIGETLESKTAFRFPHLPPSRHDPNRAERIATGIREHDFYSKASTLENHDFHPDVIDGRRIGGRTPKEIRVKQKAFRDEALEKHRETMRAAKEEKEKHLGGMHHKKEDGYGLHVENSHMKRKEASGASASYNAVYEETAAADLIAAMDVALEDWMLQQGRYLSKENDLYNGYGEFAALKDQSEVTYDAMKRYVELALSDPVTWAREWDVARDRFLRTGGALSPADEQLLKEQKYARWGDRPRGISTGDRPPPAGTKDDRNYPDRHFSRGTINKEYLPFQVVYDPARREGPTTWIFRDYVIKEGDSWHHRTPGKKPGDKRDIRANSYFWEKEKPPAPAGDKQQPPAPAGDKKSPAGDKKQDHLHRSP